MTCYSLTYHTTKDALFCKVSMAQHSTHKQKWWSVFLHCWKRYSKVQIVFYRNIDCVYCHNFVSNSFYIYSDWEVSTPGVSNGLAGNEVESKHEGVHNWFYLCIFVRNINKFYYFPGKNGEPVVLLREANGGSAEAITVLLQLVYIGSLDDMEEQMSCCLPHLMALSDFLQTAAVTETWYMYLDAKLARTDVCYIVTTTKINHSWIV